jgi:hypothetical protein
MLPYLLQSIPIQIGKKSGNLFQIMGAGKGKGAANGFASPL